MSFDKILNYTILPIEDHQIKLVDLALVVITVFVAKLFLRVLKKIIDKQLVKTERLDAGRASAAYQFAKYIAYVISIFLILEILGINVSILLAGSAALLVGFGLGVQQIFNDFVSGIILLFEGTVSKGDIIEIENIVGKVLEIKLRTSEIETREGRIIIVPNSKLVSDNVINWSHNRKPTRFEITVGVAYGSDTQKVKKLLEEAAADHKDVLKNPAPQARFLDFGDSSLNFDILFWSNRMMRVEFIKSDVRFLIDESFRKNNIEIPFPQRDVHIKQS